MFDANDEEIEDASEEEELECELVESPSAVNNSDESNRKPKSRYEYKKVTKPVKEPEEKLGNDKLKDPKAPQKKPLKIKPTEGDIEPSADASLPLPKVKPKALKKPKDEEPDVEEEPDLVSAPDEKKPDIKFKDPKSPQKKPLKIKPTEGDIEPSADASLPLPKAKPKGLKKPKDEEPDVEEEPDLVSAPDEKKPDIKFKDPKSSQKKPLKIKPTEGDIEPSTDASLPLPKAKPKGFKKPKDEDAEGEPNVDDELVLSPDENQPDIKLKPKPLQRGPLKVRPAIGDTDPDADFCLDLPNDSDDLVNDDNKPEEFEDEENELPVKKKRKRKPVKVKKPKWVPPPRTPPEPYEFPPEEKKLCDILKEEKIPPTKRYAKKPKELDVYIPFLIPWENLPAIQTQEGMGAFGKVRDPLIKIDQGSKTLVQGVVHSETVIPLISQAKGANKSGMLPFGAYRRNTSEVIDNHGFDESKLRLSESIIPKIMLGAISSQSGETAIGSLRNQTMNVKYSDYMSKTCEQVSHGFLSRQFAPTSLEMAGTCIIDRRRNIVPNVQGYGSVIGKHDKASEAIVPRLFDIQDIYQKSGSTFGSFRPLISESHGGYNMSFDEEKLCKLVIPYQTAPSLI